MIFPIEPLLNYRIWGGEYLKEVFSRKDIKEPIGEAFLVSCMPEAMSMINNQPFDVFYKSHPSYFDLDWKDFPLRINLIDAQDDLSIQMHPLAKNISDKKMIYGLEELWYVLKAEEDSKLVLGLNTSNIKEIISKINNEDLLNILNFVPVKKESVTFLPAGFVHAIGRGCLVYEVTFNLDITYRLFDYNRLDKKTGETRPLHKVEGINNINTSMYKKEIVPNEHGILFKKDSGFVLEKIRCYDELEINQDNFYFYTVINGEGSIEGLKTSIYATYFIPKTQKKVSIAGDLELLRCSFVDSSY